MRLRPCPNCRGEINRGFKIFPNYLTLSEADLIIPVVDADAAAVAADVPAAAAADAAAADAAAVAAAGLEVEAEIAAEAAAARVLANQQIVSDLMYSDG